MLQLLLGVLLGGFMVGNLLATGLDLALGDAARALRDRRFVAVSLTWAFVIGPALAWGLAQIAPIEPGYGTALVLMGLAPCAPFAPAMARKAGGEPASMAAVMLLTAIGTMIVMPLAVPILVDGLSADPWTIARPLLLYVLVPLVAGMAVRHVAAGLAARASVQVRRATTVVTVAMLVVMILLHGPAMAGTLGTGAIGVLVVYLGGVMLLSYAMAPGLRAGQRSVLSLAMGSRNFGAAFAPLVAVPDADPRATAMIAAGVPITVLLSVLAARYLARRPAGGRPPTSPPS